jgi:hypothetical protein
MKECDAMKIRTSSSLRSSLSAASFQVVSSKDCRGLAYCWRREIMTQHLLRQNPFAAGHGLTPRGSVVTLRELKMMRAKARFFKA